MDTGGDMRTGAGTKDVAMVIHEQDDFSVCDLVLSYNDRVSVGVSLWRTSRSGSSGTALVGDVSSRPAGGDSAAATSSGSSVRVHPVTPNPGSRV